MGRREPEWWWPTSAGYGVSGVVKNIVPSWPEWSDKPAEVVVLRTDEGTTIRMWWPLDHVAGRNEVSQGDWISVVCTFAPISRKDRNGRFYRIATQRARPSFEHRVYADA